MAKSIERRPCGNKFPVPTVYGLWAHSPCVRRDFEKHVLATLQKKGPIRKLNVFMEMVATAESKRAHEKTICDTQSESLANVESWAASLQNENYLAGVPLLLLRKIKARFECSITPRFIDFNTEDADVAGVNREVFFRAFPALVSNAQISRQADQGWGLQKIKDLGERGFRYGDLENLGPQPNLAPMGDMAELIGARLIEAVAGSHRLRHARVLKDLDTMMPRQAAHSGEVNLVIYGASHVEIARGAAKNNAERMIVMAPDAFLQRIPARNRTLHSILQYSYAHQTRLLKKPLTQTHCRRFILNLTLEGAIRGLANLSKRYFGPTDLDLIADSSIKLLTSQMARTFTPDEVDHLWLQLFPEQADFESHGPDQFDLKGFWEPIWLTWLTENYYPGGKAMMAAGGQIGIDPRQFPKMFQAMVHEHFWQRKGPEGKGPADL